MNLELVHILAVSRNAVITKWGKLHISPFSGI